MRFPVDTPDALATILARRSASPRHLADPVPSPEQLAILMRAAAAAPDHKLLRPVRFLIIPGSQRAALSDAFRAAKLERDPSSSAEDLERAGEKAFRGPLLMAVVLRVMRDHPRVSISDQMITAGAAVENVLLAASALGFSGCLRSGSSATSRKVRETLGLAADEDLAAFLMIGTPMKPPRPREDETDGLLSVWVGPCAR